MNWMIFIASKRGRYIYKLHNFNYFIITIFLNKYHIILIIKKDLNTLFAKNTQTPRHCWPRRLSKVEQGWAKCLAQKGQKTIFPQNILERVLISCVCLCLCLFCTCSWFYGKDLDSSRRADTKWDVSKVSTGLQAQPPFEEVVGL